MECDDVTAGRTPTEREDMVSRDEEMDNANAVSGDSSRTPTRKASEDIA